MEPETAEVCSFCAGLIPPKEDPSPSRPHYANLGLLEQSSEKCAICKVLLSDWSLGKAQEQFPDMDKEAYDSISWEVKLNEIQREDSGVSWALLETNAETRGFVFVKFVSITTCNTSSDRSKEPIWKAAITSTSDRISTLKSWLKDCEQNHPDCKPLVGEMPKRLIDVGLLDGSPPRLVLSEDLHGQDIKYATLSYCWGGANFCTTKENEASFKQEIPFQSIPKTLQDAVVLTRQLQIPYLWIDALCIVQDDHTEWKHEASRMKDFYFGSSITIAATDAADSSVGCFFTNPDTDHDANNTKVFLTINNIEDGLKTIVKVEPGEIRNYVATSVLYTRGWVLQELVLSHRAVHCMRSELYWECRSKFRTESGVVFNRMEMRNNPLPILPPYNIEAEPNKTWWKWMENYSHRRFSIPKDRLPALAGIISHYQVNAKDTPILGLWESSFHQDLLWMRIDKIGSEDDPALKHLPNIPSWSWLSCPYGIRFDFWNSVGDRGEKDITTEDHVKLLDWEVNWTSEPLMSDVKSTRLILDGPTREIVLSVGLKGKNHNPPYLDIDDEVPDFSKGYFPWKCAGQFDEGHRTTPTRYLCLLLRTRGYKGRARTRETFLILEPCLDSDAYQRAGIGIMTGDVRTFDLAARQTLSLL